MRGCVRERERQVCSAIKVPVALESQLERVCKFDTVCIDLNPVQTKTYSADLAQSDEL